MDPDSGLVVFTEQALSEASAPTVQANPARVYLASLTSPLSRSTQQRALTMIARLCVEPGSDVPPWDAIPWQRFQVAHAVALRARIIEAYPAQSTAERLVHAVRGVVKAMWRCELISEETRARFYDALKRPGGTSEVAGQELSPEAVQALFAAASGPEPGNAEGEAPWSEAKVLRARAILALLFAGGLRRSEVAWLQMDQLRPLQRAVTFRGKGRKLRVVPLGSAWEHLEPWLQIRGSEPGSVVTKLGPRQELLRDRPGLRSSDAVYRILQELGARAGVKVAPHDTRRTRLTGLFRAKLDVSQIQQFAGHSSPKTTVRYDHRPVEDLIQAIEQAPIGLGSSKGGLVP